MVIKVVATSVAHLERIIDQLTMYGLPTTSIVLSKPMQRQTITRAMVERGRNRRRICSHTMKRFVVIGGCNW